MQPLIYASTMALAAALAVATPAQNVPLTTTRVASGFSAPIWCGSPPGDETRLFVAEQTTGNIRIIRGGMVLGTPFVTVTGINQGGGERGLLGVAFHPNYATNGYFYVNYTRAADGATMIDRYTVSGNPDIANAASRTTILGPIAQPFSNHNGGNILFGRDGYLYIGLGDGGSAGDPACRAQNRLDLLGKMLRIDVDGAFPYAIPPSNPFNGNPQYRPEIWALGLRNPWRYCFDRLTGDLYIGDVGQNNIEEIDFQPGTSAGGENYGWKVMEGNNCFSNAACLTYVPLCNDPSLVRPIHQYTHAQGCSVTGGCVYRGCAVPDLRGTYFFADYCSNQIWSFRYVGGVVTQFTTRTAELAPGGGLSINTITHFGEDARGEIHIVDHSGGEVFKIVSRAAPPAMDLGFGRVGSNGRTPTFDACGILNTGNSAEFRLRFAPPNTIAVLCLSTFNNPTPLLGGILVPVPIELAAVLVCDANGSLSFNTFGGGGPATIYGQFLVVDLGLPEGVGFSNALKIDFLP
jgi:glucose/arabinose dehydrogenase